ASPGGTYIDADVWDAWCQIGIYPSPPATVQIPTALRIASGGSGSANGSCPAGQAGWSRVVQRAVVDQEVPPKDIQIANQTIGETVTVNPGGNGLNLAS